MEVAQPFPRGRIKPTASSNKSSSATDKVSGGTAAFHKKTKKNEQDFLFGPSESDSIHRPTSDANIKRRKVISSSKEIATSVASISVNPLGGGAVIPSDPGKRRPAIIESVAFSKLLPKHTKVLGIVRDVAENYAIISLPNMLTGFIRRNSTSSDPPIHHQISKNTVLAVSIQATAVEHVKHEATPKRRIEVSIHPRHMNQGLNSDILHEQMRIRGIIHSKEDHGCIVHVHIPGVTCFLPYQNVHNYAEEDNHDEEDSYDSDSSADEDDDDSATSISSKQKRQKLDDSINIRYSLRPSRIYDFVISKITRDSSANSNSNGASRIMIQLSLPDTKDAAQLLEPVPSMAQAQRNQLTTHTLKTLSPGMLVKCYIEGYAKNGLLISFFLGLFRASIEANHMGGYYVEEGKSAVDWRKLFRDSSIRHVIGRIIVVDPSSKIIRVSLLPHLLNLSIPAASELPTVGTVIQNATVVRIDKGIGALLAIPQEYTPAVAQPFNEVALEEEEELENEESDDDNNLEHHQRGRKRKKPTDAPTWSRVQSLYSIPQHFEASKVRCVYVHISKASDTNTASEGKKDPLLGGQLLKEMEFAKQFKVGSTIPAVRIISTQSWVENIASGATAPSIVEASVLSHSDIKPGVLYRSVPILSIGTYGIMVSLGQNIKAVCHFLHMYDKVPSSSENLTTSRAFAKLFAVGKKITVRCLDVDPESKRCNVTHKPSLVKDTGFIVCSYDNLPPPHEVVKGYVSKCVSDGIMVSFYNNIYGWCSAKSLQRDLGVEDVTVSYKLGDVVKCRIIKGDFRDNRWYLSVSLDITDRAISAATAIGGTNNEDSSICTNEETLKSKLPPGTVLPSGGKIVQMVNSQRSSAGRLFCGYAMVLYNEADRGITFECRLPYELVLDSPPNDDSQQPIPIQTRLDNLVAEKLCIGKKLDTEAVVLGIHSMDGATLPFISIKPRIVDAAVASASYVDDKEKRKGKSTLILPSSAADLYVGANVIGYVYHHDERHGAFIRFLNKLTGIVPKSKRGLELPLYHTITFTVGELDPTKSPPQIFLRKSKGRKSNLTSSADSAPRIRVGEFLGDVEVENINFLRAKVRLLDPKYAAGKVRARIHVTMALECSLQNERRKEPISDSKVKKHHPFYKWKIGTIVQNIYCVAIETRGNVLYLEVSNVNQNSTSGGAPPLPRFFDSEKALTVGEHVSGIITAILPRNSGLKVHISPGIMCIVSGLELDTDVDKLNDLASNFQIGSRINCSAISVPKVEAAVDEKSNSKLHDFVHLSAIAYKEKTERSKPIRGDLIVGRINTSISPRLPPALMLDLRGGFIGRCCITELNELGEWENMPLGKSCFIKREKPQSTELNMAEHESDPESVIESSGDIKQNDQNFFHGRYIQCRVLQNKKGGSAVEVSLRESRLQGNLDEDVTPETNQIVRAYVCETNKMGCFLRLSRNIRGRVILKELSDGFLPEPGNLFPMGRLVIGKVKQVYHNMSKGKAKKSTSVETTVDIDMRESSLLDQNKLSFDDIMERSKHKGVVTRVERYGVFVRLDSSDVTGMAHLSECSDSFVKHLTDHYDPGDRVKVLVIKVDKDQHRISLGLKASYFEGDSCSESDDQSDDQSSSHEDDGSIEISGDDMTMDQDSLDSEDEDYVTKLAKKSKNGLLCSDVSDEEEILDSSDDTLDEESEIQDDRCTGSQQGAKAALDTNVGFVWTPSDGTAQQGELSRADHATSDDDDTVDSSRDSSSDESLDKKTGHKSRRRASQKRKEEKDISLRESALADGTADENPETENDFERILASRPNKSEYWIKYMAYYLSIADIDAARRVAQRAFDRIEFRQEKEKMNVWMAFLTLELKYGSQNSLDNEMETACKQNNPKQVYLRMCEILEKEVHSAIENGVNYTETAEKANAMFLKMCKRFKSKKTVWLAHVKYLLKMGNSEEASNVLKRSLLSLPVYKHIEMVSKVAELEFELGSPERGRTIFLALLAKNPKRLDLLFVFIDKEIKSQNIDGARALFKSVNHPYPGSLKMKLNDKQMKSLFKKWFRMEEVYGDLSSQNLVKKEATSYVEGKK